MARPQILPRRRKRFSTCLPRGEAISDAVIGRGKSPRRVPTNSGGEESTAEAAEAEEREDEGTAEMWEEGEEGEGGRVGDREAEDEGVLLEMAD